MRTPLLRLAFILAAAQYAEGSGPTACTAATVVPTLACPTNIDNDVKTEVDCKDYTLGTACPAKHKIFMFKDAKWTEVAAVECEADTKWIVPGTPPVDLTATEIIVCAKFAPTSTKCEVCGEVAANTLCVAPSCTPGAPPVESATTGGCREFTCAATEHFVLNADMKALAASAKITCTDDKKWSDGAVDVTTAVCAKDAAPPSAACPTVTSTACGDATLVKTGVQCAAADTSSGVPTCTAPTPNLYVLVGATWKTGAVTCGASSKWELGGTPTPFTQAICTDGDPKPPTGAPSAGSCPPLTATCADAALVKTRANFECKEVVPQNGALTCNPATLDVYAHISTGWQKGAVACNADKWVVDVGGVATEVTKAVCANDDPKPSGSAPVGCPAAATLATDCDKAARVKQTVGCVAPTSTLNNELKCTVATKKLYVDDGSNGWKEGGATCDGADGKWKLDGTTTVITKALCVDDDPTIAALSVCPGAADPKVDCPTISDPAISTAVDCQNHATDLATACASGYIAFLKKSGADDKFITAGAFTCDTPNSKWIETDAAGVKYELTATDTVVCAKLTPNPCGYCDADPTVATCTLADGCAIGGSFIPSTDATTGCKELTCPPGQFFSFNSDQQADKISCNKDVKWEGEDIEVTDAVCVEKLACSVKNALTIDCTAFAPEIGCEAPVPTDEGAETGCADGKHLFYKRADDALWVKSTRNIKCDSTGKWLIDTDDKEMVKNDQLICAAKNPDACKACGQVTASAVCVAAGGATAPCTTSTGVISYVDEPTTSCKQFKCDVATDFLFMNDATVLAAGETVTCDADGKWADKDGAEITTATCAVKFDCQAKTPLALNPDICAAVNPEAGCELIPTTSYASTDPFSCPTATNALFTLPAAGGTWTKREAVWCNEQNGVWQHGPSDKSTSQPMAAGESVICALPDKTPVTIPVCIPPVSMCEDPTFAASLTCTPITDKTKTACDSPLNGYFKQVGKLYQKVDSFSCKEGKWSVAYTVGRGFKKEEELLNGYNLICAASNPDAKKDGACKFMGSATKAKGFDAQKFDFIKLDKTTVKEGQAEPGQIVDCPGDTPDKIKLLHYISDGSSELLNVGVTPYCDKDGKWMHPNGNAYGDLLACAMPKCKTCPNPTKLEPAPAGQPQEPTILHPAEFSVDSSGECSSITHSADNPFAIKYDDNDGNTNYIFYKGTIVCDASTRTWQFNLVDKIMTVQKIVCTQVGYCRQDKFKSAKTPECTSDPLFADVGCEQAIYTRNGNKEALSCATATKKMFVKRDSDEYWDEQKNNKFVCDPKQSLWVTEGTEQDEPRYFDNSFICADKTPKLRPAPTSTTPATTTLIPICALCQSHLPKMPADVNLNSTASLVSDDDDGVCVMTPKDGYQILVGKSNQVVKDGMICSRDDATAWYERRCTEVEDPENKTKTEDCVATGAKLAEFKTKEFEKNKDWKPLAYVVVAVVLILIGGMGIGCVMIFLRMRKDLSEKEKKKERGVTKKYTAANVMKTSGKSSGGRSELGKSKEPTKSKMEENDDAPTLKL